MLQSSKRNRAVSPASVPGRVWLMPALATVGFAVNFWAPIRGSGSAGRAVGRRCARYPGRPRSRDGRPLSAAGPKPHSR